jgi:ABC-type transporter Mla subunit MlaD
MASLKEAAALASQLEELAGRLHGQLKDGDVDFAGLAQLADELGREADRLAETFTTMNEALTTRLQEDGANE